MASEIISTSDPSDLTEQSSTNTRASTFNLKSFLIGGMICVFAGVLDSVCLHFAQASRWVGLPVWVTFCVFVLQTFVLSWYVGKRLSESKSMVAAWVFFFFWSLVCINLILCMVVLSSNWTMAMQLSLTFAFFAAQIGLVIVWGVLGSYDWRKRIPLFCLGLVLASYPFWLIDFRISGTRGWSTVLICYAGAVFVTCCVLRLWSFKITSLKFGKESDPGGEPKGQFTIIQLFVWTTIVAVCFGAGRFVPWQYLWESLWIKRIQFAMLAGMLMTVVTVSTCWAALGQRKSSEDSKGIFRVGAILFRILLMTVLFVLVAFGLQLSEAVNGSSAWARSFVGGWQLSLNSVDDTRIIFGIWTAWTTLNGLFLFGMLQIFAAAGCRLAKKPKGVQNKKIPH